jgi:hypothetical protein
MARKEQPDASRLAPTAGSGLSEFITTERGPGVAPIDGLVAQIVAGVHVERKTAEQAVGIIFGFLAKEAPGDVVERYFNALPGARALALLPGDDGAGLLGRVNGVMGTTNRLMDLGLSSWQVQAVTREVIQFSRRNVSPDILVRIVGAVPGLSQLA